MKNTSLKSILHKELILKGYLSYGQMADICLQEGYRPTTGERRLRKSESPNVVPVKSKSRRNTEYVSGYKWAGVSNPIIIPAEVPINEVTKENIVEENGRLKFVYKIPEAQKVWKDPAR